MIISSYYLTFLLLTLLCFYLLSFVRGPTRSFGSRGGIRYCINSTISFGSPSPHPQILPWK